MCSGCSLHNTVITVPCYNVTELLKTAPPIHRVHIECFHTDTRSAINTATGSIGTRLVSHDYIVKIDIIGARLVFSYY